MPDPKYATIKIRYDTYRALKRLAAAKPETLTALIDRLVQAEIGGRFRGLHDDEKQPRNPRDTAGGSEK